MSTKTMKEKATELLQRCEVVVLASVNKEGLQQTEFLLFGCLPERTH